jgi:hypothetical protein
VISRISRRAGMLGIAPVKILLPACGEKVPRSGG